MVLPIREWGPPSASMKVIPFRPFA